MPSIHEDFNLKMQFLYTSAAGVVNLSTEIFTDDEINLLNEGLQFALPPSNLPILDTVVNIKSSIQYLPENIQSSIRKESKDAIVRTKSIFVRPENSSSAKMITTLNSKNCFYVKSDKSNTVVELSIT
jgi:hypothetical protein